MRLLVKCLLVVLVLNTGVVFGAIRERFSTVPPLATTLANTCDNMECWFGIKLDETPRREARASIEDAGGEMLGRAQDPMRFSLGDALGIVQLQLTEGIVRQTCLFTDDFDLSDALLTFGNPDYFWIDPATQRQLFSTRNPSAAQYTMQFYLIYRKSNLIITGWLQRDMTKPDTPLDFKIPIEQLCLPDRETVAFSRFDWMSDWRGIWYPLNDYMVQVPYDVFPVE